MFVRSTVALLAAAGLSVGVAHAGIVPAGRMPSPAPCTAAEAGTVPSSGGLSAGAGGDLRLAELNWLLGVVSPGGVPRVDGEGSAGEEVRELPPPPSSLALVLSGLASFGAYHGLRSLKRLQIGPLPDWYHADAVQVGHVTPLQPEFDWSALPACVFELPSDLRQQVSYRIPRENRSRHPSDNIIRLIAPRGPPLCL